MSTGALAAEAARVAVDDRPPVVVERDRIVDAVQAACDGRAATVVVDLNDVPHVDAVLLERLLLLRATGTCVVVDLSRRHGPEVLDLVAALLDPRTVDRDLARPGIHPNGRKRS